MEKKIEKEYEDAPSGAVIFYNYKEPLMDFEDGFGYVGALIADAKSKQIQCHFCGWWGYQLGHHLHREHNMLASEYKEKVGLNKTTALISEPFREKLIAKGLAKRLKNLKNRKGKHHTEEVKERIRQTLKQNRAEIQNVNNTCPEQLLTRLTDLYNKLGRTPTSDEITFQEALERVYGSRKVACEMAGIPYRKSGENLSYENRRKWTIESMTSLVKRFYKTNKRLPRVTELPKGMQNALKYYGGKEPIYKRALSEDGVYEKVEMSFSYTNDELLRFLRVFAQINKRKPSYSDCKRGLLPHLSRYSYRFGSWKKALALAFPK